jgi:DNA-directed RNA polymerase subunit RPC12/RpoP
MASYYFPSQPYQVVYQCSACYNSYKKTIVGNSWYALDKHECPHCHAQQIPSLDIDSPANARELDPNTSFFYSEDENSRGIEESEFNSIDEQYFTLDVLSEEVLFVVSKKSSLVKTRGGSYEDYKKLIELVDKIDLKLFSLIDHCKKCQATTTTPETLQHPTQRQQNLCEMTRSLLAHASTCQNRVCHVSHCDQSRTILEYQRLFNSIGKNNPEKMQK